MITNCKKCNRNKFVEAGELCDSCQANEKGKGIVDCIMSGLEYLLTPKAEFDLIERERADVVDCQIDDWKEEKYSR